VLIDILSAAVVTVAAATDVYSRRIPNWLSLAAFGGGLLVHLIQDGPSGLPVALGGAGLGLLVFLPVYLIRAIGAGDVKLIAGVGALLGPRDLFSALIYCALAGGLISVVMLARRGLLQRSLMDIVTSPLRLQRSGAKAPYGVAIASGVYLSMLLPKVIG
jgi:prepilin peptidase CpaA